MSSMMDARRAESATRAAAFDHVVVVLFENRSLDNVLGRLYGPEDGKTFEGVIGKDLSNPIPEWAEHGAGRKVVPYTVATDMDSPNPDSGEEYFHTNTQLFNTIDDHNPLTGLCFFGLRMAGGVAAVQPMAIGRRETPDVAPRSQIHLQDTEGCSPDHAASLRSTEGVMSDPTRAHHEFPDAARRPTP
jgi:hypothetical protein